MKNFFVILLLFIVVSCNGLQLVQGPENNRGYLYKIASKDKSSDVFGKLVEQGAISFRGSDKKNEHYITWSDEKKVGVLRYVKRDITSLKYETSFYTITKGEFSSFLNRSGSKVKNGKFLLENKGCTITTAKTSQSYSQCHFILNGEQVLFHVMLKVASLNTLNLWDGNPNNTEEEELYIYDIYREGWSNWYTTEIQEAKANGLIDQLLLMGLPEVVGFQEVESAANRFELFDEGTYLREKLEQLGYSYFYHGEQETYNPVALTTAFISKYPAKAQSIPFNIYLPEFKDMKPGDKKIAQYTTRDMLQITLNLSGRHVHIINNHWRSQGCSTPENCKMSNDVRVANAKYLKRVVSEARGQSKSDDVIVLGDMNNEYWTESMLALGSTNAEALVQAEMGRGDMYNLWYELPKMERWEVSHEGRVSNLSHILIDHSSYDNSGIQYLDNSFEVVGHKGLARRTLMNEDGNPFRWQVNIIPYERMPEGEMRDFFQKLWEQRGCKPGTTSRKCRISFSEYPGIGYTDHLPLVATFSILGDHFKTLKQTAFKTTDSDAVTSDPNINTIVDKCSEKESVLTYDDLMKLNSGSLLPLKGRCVKIDLRNSPQPLLVTGLYHNLYLPVNDHKFIISIVRSFDPREIKDGEPVGTETKMHQKSHMCFARNILQGEGGTLLYTFGRLGVMNGEMAIFAYDRNDIELIDLPESKQSACKANDVLL